MKAHVANMQGAQILLRRVMHGIANEGHDRGQNAAEHLAVHAALFGIGAGLRQQEAGPAIDQQKVGDLEGSTFAQENFGLAAPGHPGLEPGPPAIHRQAIVELLVQLLDQIPEGIAHGRRDQPSRDRIERVDHHVPRVMNFGLDALQDDRGKGACEAAIILDAGIAQHIGDDRHHDWPSVSCRHRGVLPVDRVVPAPHGEANGAAAHRMFDCPADPSSSQPD